MDKTNTTKDIRAKAKGGLDLEKEWNGGFDHVRRMMAYD